MSETAVVVKDLSYSIGSKAILRQLEFSVGDGEVFALVGPSGCGKTTALRIVSGLLRPTSGRVLVLGEDPARVEPRRRRVATVWQGQALFPHLTVGGNIRFGLRVRGVAPDEMAARVNRIASRLGIEDRLDQPVTKLSGGQAQKVALARALVVEPSVLLLDEPFTGLDTEVKLSLQGDLRELLLDGRRSYIMVSHSHDEVFALADRVGVLQLGRIQQQGTPQELYSRPETEFVARFVGQRNIITGVVIDLARGGQTAFVQTAFGGWWGTNHIGAAKNERVAYAIAPAEIVVDHSRRSQALAEFRAIEGVGTRETLLLRLQAGRERREIRVDSTTGFSSPPVGGLVQISWNEEDAILVHRSAPLEPTASAELSG